MKCYFHNEIDAIATCCNCGKALCLKCVIKLEEKIVCNNATCTNKIKSMQENLENTGITTATANEFVHEKLESTKIKTVASNQAVGIAANGYKSLGKWVLLVGIFMILFGRINNFPFFTILGIIFLVRASLR